MRSLARLHECNAEMLLDTVEANELDLNEVLQEMVSIEEVNASPGREGERKFSLTLKGWSEYLKAISSLYELPE